MLSFFIKTGGRLLLIFYIIQEKKGNQVFDLASCGMCSILLVAGSNVVRSAAAVIRLHTARGRRKRQEKKK
jgi:hypothetical protein